MGGVRQWLESLGLAQYADSFEENDVVPSLLPELTDEFLQALGVLSVGHRMKLLKAVREGAPLELNDSVAPAASVGSVGEAEHRQLTVMFCDLVGSTELARRLEPEELREVTLRFQDAARTGVERFGGYVARYMGDGVLVYFGYPQAHEDDAERAVRAGLELSEVVPSLSDAPPLAVRIGIATGSVVVGDIIGEGASQESAVVGETPNLAARLQSAGTPNTVLISSATHDLVGRLFHVEALGTIALKGFEREQSVWRVLRERPTESRFDALRRERTNAFVGRRSELALLAERWRDAMDGEGQVVAVGGEPGIGKSRLAEELRRAVEEPHLVLRYQCSPYYSNSAFYPFISQLRHAARIDAESDLGRLDALIRTAGPERAEVIELFGDLLALPVEKTATRELTPSQRKGRTIVALCTELGSLSRESPVLVLFEDVHWLDPTSREALDALIENVHQLRVLLVVTHRPEFEVPWAPQGHVTTLSLNRLTARDGAMLVREAAGDGLTDNVVQEILEKTDGVPLFVEELTKAVLESTISADREVGTRVTQPAIPSTLRDSLMARLDHLGEAKQVAQIGAAIGREFRYEVLSQVTGLGESELLEMLRRLVETGLVHSRGSLPSVVYVFKHALVRDAAYDTMLRRRREQVHRQVAEVLQAITSTAPEILAHHFTQAACPLEGLRYWREAGELALTRSGNREAMGYFETALSLVGSVPSVERQRVELEIQLALGAASIAPRSYAAEEVRRAYARASELARELQDRRYVFSSLRGLWNCHYVRAELSQATALSEDLAGIASAAGSAEQRMMSHRIVGATQMGLGRYAVARAEFQRALDLYQPERQAEYVVQWGEDPGLFCGAYLAWVNDWLGERGAAHVAVEQSLLQARGLPNRYGQASTYSLASLVYRLRGDPLRVLELTAEAAEIAAELGIVQWLAWAQLHRGWALAATGETRAGVELSAEGLDRWRSAGGRFQLPYISSILAEALTRDGRSREALQVLDAASEFQSRAGYGIVMSEWYRQRGEVLIALGESEEGEMVLRAGLGLADQQAAPTLALRCALPLARALSDRGELGAARVLVEPILLSLNEAAGTLEYDEAMRL